jgi:hypothetical protein
MWFVGWRSWFDVQLADQSEGRIGSSWPTGLA